MNAFFKGRKDRKRENLGRKNMKKIIKNDQSVEKYSKIIDLNKKKILLNIFHVFCYIFNLFLYICMYNNNFLQLVRVFYKLGLIALGWIVKLCFIFC